MEAVLNFIANHSVADIMIGLIGVFGFVLIFDRYKALFLDYHLPAEDFMKQVTVLLHAGKVDEAITFCSANQKKPLAYVIKRILERSDRDEKAIHMSLDIAAAEVAPGMVRNLNHLPMVANVVTLMGLFGTVIGLIIAFKALGYADPTQKQTVLAQGISTAMTATAFGLMVSIPVMFCYSFLYTRQSRLFAEIDQNANKVLEILNDRAYFPMNGAYPNLNHENANTKGMGMPDTKSKRVG